MDKIIKILEKEHKNETRALERKIYRTFNVEKKINYDIIENEQEMKNRWLPVK